MSASQDKKKRQQERAEGVEKRQVAQQKAFEEKRKSKRQWTLGTIVVVILVAVILLANSSIFAGASSVKIGGESYSNAEYQYYYKNTYYQFYNSFSSYISMFFDPSKALDTQEFNGDYLEMFGATVPETIKALPEGESATWADYFRESALDSMEEITALYEAAVAEGYTISEEDAAGIDEQIEQIGLSAKANGFKNAKTYLGAMYGKGCNEKVIRRLLTMGTIAENYGTDNLQSFTYTSQQYEAWYAENKESLDVFDYMYYYVAAETVETTTDVTAEDGTVTPETTSAATEETMAAAKVTADDIAAKAVSEAAFTAAVAESEEGATPTTGANTAAANISTLYSEWMLDSARSKGDVTVVEQENGGYYVVMFLGRSDNHYPTVSMRHVLMNVTDQDENGEYTDSEKNDTQKVIENLYNEWKSGAATEESFAEMANEYSDDAGSNTNGGLYEDIYNGQMVGEINDFLFDPATKPGDTKICFNEGSYTGYHIVYFVGEGRLYSDVMADNALRTEDYNAWMEGVTEGYKAETTSFFRFAETD